MRTFKTGQIVTVKSFTATVGEPWDNHTACVQVVDSGGNYHYVFETQIEKPLPFTDGESYVDADGDILIFRATGREGGPGWEKKTLQVMYGITSTHRGRSTQSVP